MDRLSLSHKLLPSPKGQGVTILTVDQIVTQIINQLRLLDPTVSAEVGTPEREIIEAVAELIASQQVDFTVLNQQFDISSMSSGRLDAYLSVFNFGRQQATPSNGAVTFASLLAATTAVTIPAGTQVIANTASTTLSSLTFVTTQAAILAVGQTTVTVPVQCTIAGTIGNVDANTVVGFASLNSISGISTVTNASAMTNGQDQESDTTYKTRFQNTFLRNVSGTDDMYLALAVSQNGVSKAIVVGPISRYQEYVQVPNSDDSNQVTPYDTGGTIFAHKRTTAESTIPYSKTTYDTNYYLTNGTLDPSTARFYKPGVDYIFNTPPWNGTTGAVDSAHPYTPDITFLNLSASALAGGEVLLLEHAYISKNSRNDLGFGILNCVDIFVNGENDTSADSVELVPTASNNLQSTNANIWTYQHPASTTVINFKRVIDGTPSAVGSRMQPLYWQPVVAIPDNIQVGTATYYQANFYNTGDSTYYNQFDGTTYSLKAHYILAQEVNGYYGTIRSRNGIEWFLSGNNYLGGQLPTDSSTSYTGPTIDTLAGTQFTVEGYLYDSNISDLQAIMEQNKQTTSDVLVHKAKLRYFQPIITVMYTFGTTQSVVNASIIVALANFFETQYYGQAVQLSDILQVIHNVPGVDNVRWTNQDSSGNKVQEVNADGSALSGGAVYFTTDFFVQDNELAQSPNTDPVVITVRAQNTWGT